MWPQIDKKIKYDNNMKRSHSLRLILFIVVIGLSPASWSQPLHVEQAFTALLQASSNGKDLKTTTYVDAQTGAQAKHSSYNFTIPVAQGSLIDDIYKAFEADEHLCTQYERDDAHSAHTWAVPIQVPGTVFEANVDANTNYLQGGFIDSSSVPTAYFYYVLTWQASADGKSFFGRVNLFSMDAHTQHPAIRQPSKPSYDALLTAIKSFTSSPQNYVSCSFHWARAAATGQWIRRYNTWGFNFPLERESELLSPLYRAFEAERSQAYRFLNKPAGQTAENVSIIVDDQGGNLGLGSQTDWNIIYAYFADEDFPQNRYVYALWYKVDVPRQCIVGELMEINTERPDGGIITNPFVQRSVPEYLWQFGAPKVRELQKGQGALPASTVPPETQTSAASSVTMKGLHGEELVMSYEGNVDDAFSPELSTLRDVLTGKEYISFDNNATTIDCEAGLLNRGMDLGALNRELDSYAREFALNRTLYAKGMDTYVQMYKETNDQLRQHLQLQTNEATWIREQDLERLLEARKSLAKADYDKQLVGLNEKYGSTLRQMSTDYSQALQAANADYETQLKQLAEEYNGRMSFFGKDGTPAQFIHRVFDHLITAYHADGTLLDAAVAKKMSTLAKLMGEFGNAETKAFYLNRLQLLQNKRRGTLADSSLADAVVCLGGERGTPGITTSKQFNKQFNKHYDAANSAIKRYRRGKKANMHTVRYYLTQLSTFCCNSASLATNPAAYIDRLNQLRAAFVDANASYYTRSYHTSVEDVTPIHTLFDQAIEAFSRHVHDVLSMNSDKPK